MLHPRQSKAVKERSDKRTDIRANRRETRGIGLLESQAFRIGDEDIGDGRSSSSSSKKTTQDDESSCMSTFAIMKR